MSIKITAEIVKNLRDKTGISVMQCKNALEEADGDVEKALIILKNKSSGLAIKKADRNAKDGVVIALETEGKILLLGLHTETDFVARNADFLNLANQLAKIALDEGLEKMKAEAQEMINLVIQKVGEKIELGQIQEIKGEILGSYVHNNKIAVAVSLNGGSKELAKDIAMHITAMKPVYVKMDEITDEDKTKVVEVFEKEIKDLDKPEDIKKKVLDGKISTYFKEQTLMEQPFIKNPELTVGQFLKNQGATFLSFVRESIG